jgi:hypothetical protein
MNLFLAWDSSVKALSSLPVSLRPRCSSPPTALAGGPPFSCSSVSCIFTFTSMVSLSGSIPRPNSNSRRIPDRSLGRLLTFDGRVQHLVVRLATTVYVAFRHFPARHHGPLSPLKHLVRQLPLVSPSWEICRPPASLSAAWFSLSSSTSRVLATTSARFAISLLPFAALL